MIIKWLVAEITKHNELYWVKNKPEISDEYYDALIEDLRKLDPDHKLLSYVGEIESGRRKVKHDIPMSSLDKCYTEDELLAWATKVARDDTEQFYVDPKYDGISSSVDGDLVLSRGDGEFGEDISDVLCKLYKAPEQGRGELVVFKSELKQFSHELPRPYKTCRSAAAGLVAKQDLPLSTPSILRFMSFDTHESTIELQDFKNIDWEATMQDYQDADYPTDGLVISLVDKKYGESLGVTDHHPKHSIALKYKNPKGETKLLDIEWQLGKYKLTPVAILKPVEISGYTHTKASLHNWDQVQKLNIKLGNTIILQRSGDVIPNVISVTKTHKQHKSVELPNCPACGKLCAVKGVDVVCINNLCEGYKAKKLFDGLDRLGLANVGPVTANTLVYTGADTPAKVLNLDLITWKSVSGDKLGTKLFAACRKIKSTPIEDYKVVAALNIKGFGVSLAKKVLNVLTLNELRTATDISHIEGVGSTMSSRITNEINSTDLIAMLQILQVEETKGLAAKPLVCFTGKSDKTRDEWIALARSKGYTFNKAVTKKLSLLVTGGRSSTKSKKAEKYGIEILTYTEFEERVNA